MVRLAVACLLPLLLTLAACGNGGPREWSRPYEGYLPDTEDERFAVVLVRDKRTGRPIPKARLRAHPENELGPKGWAPLRAEATTDEFGLAWIPRSRGEGIFHWAVEAEGYAPTEEEYGSYLSEVVELMPDTDRFGRILDVYGRPIQGVQVEYKVGCAHSPALRRAMTDQDGSFTLRRIGDDGDVPLERGGIRATYWRASDLGTKGEPIPEFHTLPGHTVTGRVLDAAGRPAARVGAVLPFDKPNLPPARPRGEITVVLSDGSPAEIRSYRLFHAAPWFYRDRDDMTGVPGAHFRIRTLHPGGGPRATRYGRLEGAGPWTVRLGSAALRVTVTLPEDDDGEDRVLCVDGEIFQLESDPTAVVTGLLPGPHTVLVGAPGRVGRAMRVVLKEAETREIRVRLPRRPGR